MKLSQHEHLRIHRYPRLNQATLVLAFSGWMDGGDVSTGTVSRLIHLLDAQPIAEIDPEPFYIYNFPGSMEVASLFRPHVEVENGITKRFQLPNNSFFVREDANLLFFVGKEPNLHWRTFGNCIFLFGRIMHVSRILFVGSFGGSVPHTREPRLYITCSDEALLKEMRPYGARASNYRGPGSFTSYLLTHAESAGMEMVSLAAEIPSYVEGTNPQCIEAVTRRLAKILKVPVELASLRTASTEWELHVSSIIDQNPDLADTVRKLEEAYDNELLAYEAGESDSSEQQSPMPSD